ASSPCWPPTKAPNPACRCDSTGGLARHPQVTGCRRTPGRRLKARPAQSTYLSRMPANATRDLVERLDRLLPQTQCGQCGFDGCRPYADAMAAGAADVDRCPPGGDEGALALARVLG